MTDKVNPSINRPAEAFKTAGAIALAGGANPGYVTPASSPSELSVQDGSIDETALNAFAESHSASSFDVTIDPGEGFVYGSWLAIDTSATVTLASSTSNQTVYVGWNKDGTNDVIVGLSSVFDNASGNTDKKIPLYDFDTDGSGVTAVSDRREIGQYQTLSHLEVAEELGIPVYADSTNAPQNEGNVIVIDGSGSQAAGIYSHDGSSYVKAGNTDEAIQDLVNSTLAGGTNVTTTYDDANGTITIDTSALNEEEVEDAINTLITGGTGITTSYDDANDTLTISGHTRYTDEEAQDAVGTITSGGGKVTATYDDANNTLTIDTSALDAEEVQDEVSSLLSSGNAISLTYDDANNTLTIDVSESNISLANLSGDSDDITEGTSNLFFTDERAQDAISSLLSGGTNVTTTYDDANNTLTIDTSALNQEEVEDAVNTLITGGTGITTSYDDANNTLTISGHSRYTDEEAQDAVGTILGSLFNYDDATPAIALSIGDGEILPFGNSDDVSIRYDSAADDFRWQDETNGLDRMALNRTTGDLSIEGTLTEGATL